MSLYRLHFKWKEKEVTLKARNLDMTHPYFVAIKEIIFEDGSGLIIDPAQDEIRKTFGDAENLMIPFQSVSFIEELKSEPPSSNEERVRPFAVVDDGGEEGDS